MIGFTTSQRQDMIAQYNKLKLHGLWYASYNDKGGIRVGDSINRYDTNYLAIIDGVPGYVIGTKSKEYYKSEGLRLSQAYPSGNFLAHIFS